MTMAGAGGTVTAVAGEKALAVIDSGFGARTAEILTALKSFDPRSPTWLINTHWHFDHTDGNQRFRDVGATVVAHHNTRRRMEQGQHITQLAWDTGPAPKKALPDFTIGEDATLDLGSSEVQILYQPNAHTDGDLALLLADEDIIVAGDLFTNGSYPVIDGSTGGSLRGTIAALKHLELLAGSRTVFVPGHGELASTDDLKRFIEMLVTVDTSIEELQAKGLSKEEILAAKPTSGLDETWGRGYVTGDKFLGMVIA
jgi:glyoxylase-like metal-dependent hydrolase (beta-lactamase superfamily II)